MTFKPTGRAKLYACIAGAEYGLSWRVVLGDRKDKVPVKVRREVWRRMEADGLSYSAIARATGRDHSTVMFGLGRLARNVN